MASKKETRTFIMSTSSSGPERRGQKRESSTSSLDSDDTDTDSSSEEDQSNTTRTRSLRSNTTRSKRVEDRNAGKANSRKAKRAPTSSQDTEKPPEDAQQQMKGKSTQYLREKELYDPTKFSTPYDFPIFVASILEHQDTLGKVFAEQDYNVPEFPLSEEERLDFGTCSARTYHQQISDLQVIVQKYLVIQFRKWFQLVIGHPYNSGHRQDQQSLIMLLRERSTRKSRLSKKFVQDPDPAKWDIAELVHAVRALLFSRLFTLDDTKLRRRASRRTSRLKESEATELDEAADVVGAMDKICAGQNRNAQLNADQMSFTELDLMREKMSSSATYLGATRTEVRKTCEEKPQSHACSSTSLERTNKQSLKEQETGQFNYDRLEREEIKREQLINQAKMLARLGRHMNSIAQDMVKEDSTGFRYDPVVDTDDQND